MAKTTASGIEPLVGRPRGISSLVSQRLQSMIESGQLPPGSRLPPERVLAESLGVSRTSVREAVHELWLKGLVERHQGRGTFVTEADSVRESLVSHVHDGVSEAERPTIVVMDYRAAVEPGIAACAALRARPADIAFLQQTVLEMEAAASAAAAAKLDTAFHHGVARATGNPLLIELDRFSAKWLGKTRERNLQGKRRREAGVRAHRAILQAITDRDSESAAAAMSEHIREVTALVEARLRRARSARAQAAYDLAELDLPRSGEGPAFDQHGSRD